MPLEDYRSKRDFRRTGEPKGRPGKSTRRRFVVQKHDAAGCTTIPDWKSVAC